MYNRSVNQVHPDKQEYLDILWDLFKDVHGVRPRGMYDNTWPLEDLMQQVSFLQGCLDDMLAQEAADEARTVASVMAVGCPDEATAQRWLDDAWEIY
tara:strand:- start:554 stop:844 length:291 start_codon:yes stop_codon:yes gene_type:complete